MGANQNQQNQVFQVVQGNGLQTAPFGLPIGANYDPSKKATFGQRLMQGLGYAGSFAKGSMESGTPSLLGGLGGLGNHYNVQQYNQAQLKQQQDAMERARAFEMAQREKQLQDENELRVSQGLAPIAPSSIGGSVSSPEDVRANLTYVGSALGNQAMVNETQGKGFNPQVGALVSEQYVLDRLKTQRDNLSKMATLGKTSEALTAGANAGFRGLNTAGVPQSAITPNSPTPAKGGKGGTAQWAGTVNTLSQKYGVDPNLVMALMRQESGGNPTAKSKAGAMGLMQLMPATAKGLGVKDPFDPAQNIEGGIKYLAQKMKQHGGNLDHVLASYNAGSGAVQKYGGIPPYKETQNYVKVIKANYQKQAPKASPSSNSPKSTVAQGNPQAQGAIMGSLNAYNNSPALRQQAINNPYLVGIADPNALGESFARGAGVQQNVNSTNQAYYQNNLQDKQASQTLAYNYANLGETKRQNTNSEKQTAINADINARQKQAEAIEAKVKAEAERVTQLENQNTKLLEAMSKKDVSKEQQVQMQKVINNNNAMLGTLQTGLPFNQQNGSVDFANLWSSPPPPKAQPTRSTSRQPKETAKVNRKYNSNTQKWE